VISAPLGAGLRRIHAALRSDGALPAAQKAVAMAFAHAVRDQPALIARELDRARELGADPVFVGAACSLLLLNRGERAFTAFTLAARERFALPAPGAEPGEATPESALAYFAEHFGGEVPARQRLFAQLAPEAFVGYQLMHRGALQADRRRGELLLCTALAATYEFGLLDVHVTGARSAGASEAELAEALLCAVPASGLTAWAGGAGAIERTRVRSNAR
jgi:alkylhydroperoxidase/carboxymuconolactone decarboxylase family protein YurZ